MTDIVVSLSCASKLDFMSILFEDLVDPPLMSTFISGVMVRHIGNEKNVSGNWSRKKSGQG